VDELHEALASTTLADALGLISAQHLWGLSGTLPVSTAGDVADLAALFGVAIPVDATNAGRFLDCYVRRNTASATESIPVDEHCHVVRRTPMERALYLACRHDFDQPIAVPEAHESYIPAFLSTWRGLQEHGREAALVKLCCHHQATTTDIELLSTPAQSVARLRVWKRHHCEEARRLIKQHAALAEWMHRGCQPLPEGGSDGRPGLALPGQPIAGGQCDKEAWQCASEEISQMAKLSDEALLQACEKELEATPFALCERPLEAEARWLDWCKETGLAPGTRGAISRLRKIMYDELWGRLIDGKEGWQALSKMAGRSWQADYAAAQRNRMLEALADYASSLRSARFLEGAIQQAAAASPGEMECGICLGALRSPRITPCSHIFCKGCIERSLGLAANCPQCRAVIRGPGQLSEFNIQVPEETDPAASSRAFRDGSRGDGPDGVNAFGSKISALVARLQAIQQSGEKAVVFAQWQDLIFKIHTALVRFGIPAAVLAGGAFDRAATLQRFESPELPVLLLSLEDSASGTNMAHASHVILVHPMVACSAEEQRAYEAQAVGRVRRWGQQRRVQVWRFVTEGTIEADFAAQRTADAAAAAAAAADALFAEELSDSGPGGEGSSSSSSSSSTSSSSRSSGSSGSSSSRTLAGTAAE